MSRKIEILIALVISVFYFVIDILLIFNSKIFSNYQNAYIQSRIIGGCIAALVIPLGMIIFYDRIPVFNRDGSATPGVIIQILGWIILIGLPGVLLIVFCAA
jgi:hypothetical protein